MNVTIYKPELDVINSIAPKKNAHRLDLSYVQFIFEYNKTKKEQNIQIVVTDAMRMLVVQKHIKNVLVKNGKNKTFEISPKMLSVLFDEYNQRGKKGRHLGKQEKLSVAEIPFVAIKNIASIIENKIQYPGWKLIDKKSKNKEDKNVFSFGETTDYRTPIVAHFKKECGFNLSFLNDFSRFVKRINAPTVDFFQKDYKSVSYTTIIHAWAVYKFYLMPVSVL